MLRMSEFLLENLQPIMLDWDDFARQIRFLPSALSQEVLRDHAEQLLTLIARDMEAEQSPFEQREKSRGLRGAGANSGPDSVPRLHADTRIEQGFTLSEVVAEYRALRASVVRLWMVRQMDVIDKAKLDELTRFNEAVDESVSESIDRYIERVDRSRNLLLGALGHDLRNPLGAILQATNLVLRPDCPDHARATALARILTSGARMSTMISDLLDFSRTRLGDKLPVSVAPMNICEACQSVVDEIALLHPNRAFRFQSPGAFTGSWDRARIEQMLSNLIGNAAEHGFPHTSVRVEATATESSIFIAVHNEGFPIPQRERHRIFEPLVRGSDETPHAVGTKRSLGLGLSIASEIAKAHGGRIDLTVSDESGTTFTVQLPRGRDVEE
jgi:signal transduction histidine kinase